MLASASRIFSVAWTGELQAAFRKTVCSIPTSPILKIKLVCCRSKIYPFATRAREQSVLERWAAQIVLGTPMFNVIPTPRVRASPFYDATVADGVKGFTAYNRMLLPTSYGDPEGEYWRLLQGVSMWDVACERQVQLKGSDAGKLAQLLSTRDLTTLSVERGKYAPICNHQGILLNDPVVNKLSDDVYWISIADSQIQFWASAIAAERSLSVEVSEPDVSPLAVQGPHAEKTVCALLGEWVGELGLFRIKETEIEGIPLIVGRSGYSKQGGFELYLCDGTKGSELWNLVKEAGRPWDIRPGTPNHSERIESGLLSFGCDTDDRTNPYEVRLGKFVDLRLSDEVIGIRALRGIKQQGIQRHQLGVVINAKLSHTLARTWCDVLRNGNKIGSVTSTAYSWRMQANVGLALVSTTVQAGDCAQVVFQGKKYEAQFVELPFF